MSSIDDAVAKKSEALNTGDEEKRGKELHREFVGMLFALATAELAVQAATVVNSGAGFEVCLPAYSHLTLGFLVVATSWVGWGWSKSSLSNIESVFSRDFVELVLDVWLVAVYFFIAKGVELPTAVKDKWVIAPSLFNEERWIAVIFCTYLFWDVWTKVVVGPRRDATTKGLLIVQRGWASVVCAVLAVVAYLWLSSISTPDAAQVVLGDLSLMALVALFRAMKIRNLCELRGYWCLVGVCFLIFVSTLIGAAQEWNVGS